MRRKTVLFLTALAVVLAASGYAFATTNTGMPWETPLEKIMASLTGRTAMAISIIALVVCAFGLIWGAEIGEIMKKIIYTVILMSVIIFASSFIKAIFPTAGALIY